MNATGYSLRHLRAELDGLADVLPRQQQRAGRAGPRLLIHLTSSSTAAQPRHEQRQTVLVNGARLRDAVAALDRAGGA
jgi:hypothetical protein